MVEKEMTVNLKSGLQARPAALFVQEANKFNAYIYLVKGGKKVNAKSIMGIMSLAVGAEAPVTLIAEGADETEAVAALQAFVSQEHI
ncbi:catabolite repression HPr-like protein [Scopulibacillus darangshiensis]|uniref:Catabolite repression HPr-like protein n=1 Tax=Scopulibacillus darangshiensis TaxID=442528 RepID=A0A4R2NSP6_9BACL|nr:HPr family phosphocarrier protein [Scopulibacillus darangshiensis]TCP24867.1 catabolite repression HPr-like protein [Scopulibacillus darangshiensis]